MACPFFYPTQPLEEKRRGARSPMPLGDAYDGECHAGALYRPSDEELKDLCNLGYARYKCPRFHRSQDADAARFSVNRDQQESVVISYVQERDHRPFQHGTLEYLVAAQNFAAPHPDPNVHQQALAYVGAYLRRKAALSATAGAGRR